MTDFPAIERIRSIFLHPSLHVSMRTAAELLGVSPKEFEASINAGEIEVLRTGLGRRILRQELIALALNTWPIGAIEEALGTSASQVLPEALRLAELRARIPRYQIAMPKYLARRDHTNVSTVLTNQLEDLACAAAEEFSSNIAGFAAAVAWPEPAGKWVS